MKTLRSCLTICTVCFFTSVLTLPLASNSYAQWNGDITLASDYLFNGVSQTDEKPALQAGLTWSAENGLYAGTWASNVDYDDLANFELDAYLGYSLSLNEQNSLDFGISQYNYFGSSNSSTINYAELYIKYHLSQSSIAFWYAWDYFGTDAGHYIVMASHNFILTDSLSILVGIDKSTSLDSNKWQWQANDDDYIHGQISVTYSFKHFDFSLGLHGTDLEDYGDTKLLLSISHGFG
ncbi:TorF family putative porin [Colwellia psychrerythraea]|uniref:Uncharacterized protein n=1 Tax=Colwellia psychrerythraea TaxID=28229 RepID=A0A099KM62_COLPS|nr:TorF family putative porin [Colwellia psychrerythraea]KGJ90708.1 Conserved hypothetical protein CHP02001 [Colwellia psychrerythraea]